MKSGISIELTKISPTHHRFVIVREGGVREEAELETKSFLTHDFLHFAFETEAGLQNSFYGTLASGRTYAELSDGEGVMSTSFDASEAATTEQIVGALHGITKGEVNAADIVAGVENMWSAYGRSVPEWFTEEFIDRVKERYRKLIGEWNATPFKETMRLRFPD